MEDGEAPASAPASSAQLALGVLTLGGLLMTAVGWVAISVQASAMGFPADYARAAVGPAGILDRGWSLGWPALVAAALGAGLLLAHGAWGPSRFEATVLDWLSRLGVAGAASIATVVVVLVVAFLADGTVAVWPQVIETDSPLDARYAIAALFGLPMLVVLRSAVIRGPVSLFSEFCDSLNARREGVKSRDGVMRRLAFLFGTCWCLPKLSTCRGGAPGLFGTALEVGALFVGVTGFVTLKAPLGGAALVGAWLWVVAQAAGRGRIWLRRGLVGDARAIGPSVNSSPPKWRQAAPKVLGGVVAVAAAAVIPLSYITTVLLAVAAVGAGLWAIWKARVNRQVIVLSLPVALWMAAVVPSQVTPHWIGHTAYVSGSTPLATELWMSFHVDRSTPLGLYFSGNDAALVVVCSRGGGAVRARLRLTGDQAAELLTTSKPFLVELPTEPTLFEALGVVPGSTNNKPPNTDRTLRGLMLGSDYEPRSFCGPLAER